MKKRLAWFLLFALLITALCPAFGAAAEANTVPITNSGDRVVVMLSGDGEAIYDTEGKRMFKFSDLLSLVNGGGDGDNQQLLDSVANVMKPFMLQGLLQNNWDPFYENLQAEVSELTEGLRPNENGDVVNGTDIGKNRREANDYNMTHDNKQRDGSYNAESYHFWYDWRKDPLESAEELHAYLEAVRKATGQEEISLLGRCLGNNVIAAYLSKYGTKGIYGLGIDGTVSYGSEYITEALTGRFHLDTEAIERLIQDSNRIGRTHLDPFLMATIDVVNASGVPEKLIAATEAMLYKKLVEGMTSALALSTFFTMPCYWAVIKPEDYETAKNYVFGPEGSEKRQQYAGLIQKTDNYQHTVRDHMDEILTSIPQAGKKMAVISKYGFQIMPLGDKMGYVADQYAAVSSSSFGATTSTMFTRLPDDYIAQREAEGKGKYISPDRMIDASTCLFPDYTWFTKNIPHSEWTWTENALLYTVITADTQYTSDDLVTTRFMVKDAQTGEVVPMTTDNCNTESWLVQETAPGLRGGLQKLQRYFNALITWFKYLFQYLKTKLAKG